MNLGKQENTKFSELPIIKEIFKPVPTFRDMFKQFTTSFRTLIKKIWN